MSAGYEMGVALVASYCPSTFWNMRARLPSMHCS